MLDSFTLFILPKDCTYFKFFFIFKYNPFLKDLLCFFWWLLFVCLEATLDVLRAYSRQDLGTIFGIKSGSAACKARHVLTHCAITASPFTIFLKLGVPISEQSLTTSFTRILCSLGNSDGLYSWVPYGKILLGIVFLKLMSETFQNNKNRERISFWKAVRDSV